MIELGSCINRRQAIALATGAILLKDGPLTAFSAPPRVDGMQKKVKKGMIILFGEGGPASQDSFDPKRSSQVERFYGETETSVPGVHFAEPWQHLAKVADRLTLFRAHHAPKSALHSDAVPDALGNREALSRDTNGVIEMANASNLPAVFIHTPKVVEQSSGIDLRQLFLYHRGLESRWDQAGYRYTDPINGKPNPKLKERMQLLRALEQGRTDFDDAKAVQQWHEHRDRAESMLSGTLKGLTKLSDEDVRRYCGGPATPEGLAVLHARELVRLGIAHVVMVRTGGIGATKFQTYGWDHHYDAKNLMDKNIPVLDRSAAELIRDTDPKKGLMPETSVVLMSDMGRTPKISSQDKGRDHFSWRTSVVASPGLEPGVVGRTDNSLEGDEGVITNADFMQKLAGLMK